jgi:hypothetical protein
LGLSFYPAQSNHNVSLLGVLSWLQTTWLSHAIAEANHMLVASLQIVHVFGFIFLIAPVILIGLRVAGLVLRDQPLRSLLGPCRRFSLVGLSMSLASGAVMFLSAPLHYYENWAFDTKMLLLILALIVYGVSLALAGRNELSHRVVATTAVSASVLLWIAVCMAGRAIGFV